MSSLCTGCTPCPDDVTKNTHRDNDASLQLFRQHSVLPSNIKCPHCERDCWYRKEDHFWVCTRTFFAPKSKKRKRCEYSISDYKGTFLERSNIDAWKIVSFINKWCSKRYLQADVIRNTGISSETCVNWRSFCSEVCEAWLQHQDPIGGPGIKVEIDETLITRRKANVGRVLTQIWLFGGIERESKKRVIVPLLAPEGERRDRATLVPIIKRFIKAGSIIFSDSWGAYNTLSAEGYTHHVVNHSEHFVDPTDKEIYTQTVERLWRDVKEWVRRPGMKSQYLRQYLAKYIFMSQCRGKEIHTFLLACSKLYPHVTMRQKEDAATVSSH